MGSRRAVVLGASGLVGSRCVARLAERPEYGRVTCLVRRAWLGGAGIAGAKPEVEERIVDFSKLDAQQMPEADDVYCALGSTMKKAGSKEAFREADLALPLRLAELALARGAKRMALVSSVGADANARTFYLKTKGELEDALRRVPFRALHVFRPGPLGGQRQESRPLEAVGIAVGRVAGGLLVGGLRKYRLIDADDVARAMIAATLGDDPSGTERIYEYDAMMALARQS